MKRKIFVLLGCLIILFLGAAYFFLDKNHKTNNTLTLYGNVDIRQVDLGFRVFGKVKTLYVDEGDFVKPGQLIAELDKVPYQEQLSSARAKLLAQESELSNALAKFQKRDQVTPPAISKEEYDNAFYNLELTKATVEEAKAALELATTNYEDTNLIAPSEGTILTRIREPGSVVNVGEPVFTLSIESPVWIRAYVSEPNLGKVKFGMEAKIKIDMIGSKTYLGHIGFISPVAEFTPKSVETTDLRTDLVYRLRVIVDDPDHVLKQGMPVTVILDK